MAVPVLPSFRGSLCTVKAESLVRKERTKGNGILLKNQGDEFIRLWCSLRLFINILALFWAVVGLYFPNPTKVRHGSVTCCGQ